MISAGGIASNAASGASTTPGSCENLIAMMPGPEC